MWSRRSGWVKPVSPPESRPTPPLRKQKVELDDADLDVLCESLWHALSRADVPDDDLDRMRILREKFNELRK